MSQAFKENDSSSFSQKGKKWLFDFNFDFDLDLELDFDSNFDFDFLPPGFCLIRSTFSLANLSCTCTLSLHFALPVAKDRNCQVNEVCDKGQCRDPCSIEGTCGLNAFCNVIRHKKQCVCPADFTGNPEVECVRIPSTCYSSSDCPQPMQCADGICMPPCNTDENCAINERCLQGLCMRKSLFRNHEA